MDLWRQTNWYVVQSKPCREKLATASLAELDVEVFFPRAKQEQLVCGTTRWVTVPLFPCYFFAHFCPLLSFEAVRYAKGVLRVVGTSRSPLPVDETIITSIQDRVQADGLIRLEPQPLRPGDRVKVGQGPLAGWIGEVEQECDNEKRVSILLEVISKARVLIEKRWLIPAVR